MKRFLMAIIALLTTSCTFAGYAELLRLDTAARLGDAAQVSAILGNSFLNYGSVKYYMKNMPVAHPGIQEMLHGYAQDRKKLEERLRELVLDVVMQSKPEDSAKALAAIKELLAHEDITFDDITILGEETEDFIAGIQDDYPHNKETIDGLLELLPTSTQDTSPRIENVTLVED